MAGTHTVRMDHDQDIIFKSVGLYKMFMAAGAAGQEANLLYDHLIFTARLQTTNQVRATDEYLRNGLGWGLAKVKRAKAFLSSRGLIEYVKDRRDDGRILKSFIRITAGLRLPETAVQPTGSEIDPVASGDGMEIDPPASTGSKTDPVAPTGSDINRVADHTYGPSRQMLKERKEMLEERKRNGPDGHLSEPPVDETANKTADSNQIQPTGSEIDPVVPDTRRDLEREVREWYESRQPGKRFEDYPVEIHHVKLIVDRALKYEPENARAWLDEFMATHERLKNNPRHLLHDHPLLPSMANSGRLVLRILDAMTLALPAPDHTGIEPDIADLLDRTYGPAQ